MNKWQFFESKKENNYKKKYKKKCHVNESGVAER